MSVLKTFRESVCAGVLIALGGSVFLGAENRTAGAVLFALALLCISYKGYYLYTGKVCYLRVHTLRSDGLMLLCGLSGNLLTVWLLGRLVCLAVPTLGLRAETLCAAKLEQSLLQTFLRGVFCGNLVYLAVSIFKENGSPLPILYAVPAFILSGFEHSIADLFYFSAASVPGETVLGFMAAVIIGNTLGGLALPLLMPKEET